MKITRKQLRQIIKEAIKGHVHDNPAKPRFLDLVMSAMAKSDYRRAANSIMDSYMISDINDADEAMLVDMLARAKTGSPQEIEALADQWYRQTFGV